MILKEKWQRMGLNLRPRSCESPKKHGVKRKFLRTTSLLQKNHLVSWVRNSVVLLLNIFWVQGHSGTPETGILRMEWNPTNNKYGINSCIFQDTISKLYNWKSTIPLHTHLSNNGWLIYRYISCICWFSERSRNRTWYLIDCGNTIPILSDNRRRTNGRDGAWL